MIKNAVANLDNLADLASLASLGNHKPIMQEISKSTQSSNFLLYIIWLSTKIPLHCQGDKPTPNIQGTQDCIQLPTMDITSNETARTLSRRGYIYATGAKKTLENVINNLWDPEDNLDGFVSLGVAENVKSCRT